MIPCRRCATASDVEGLLTADRLKAIDMLLADAADLMRGTAIRLERDGEPEVASWWTARRPELLAVKALIPQLVTALHSEREARLRAEAELAEARAFGQTQQAGFDDILAQFHKQSAALDEARSHFDSLQAEINPRRIEVLANRLERLADRRSGEFHDLRFEAKHLREVLARFVSPSLQTSPTEPHA